MADLQAQIAEKKRRIEELRRQMAQPTQVPPVEKLIQTTNLQQQSQITDLEKRQLSESPQKTTKKENPTNLVGMFIEQKRKKLGQQAFEIFDKPDQPKQQKDTFECGIQCELNPTQETRQQLEEYDQMDESLKFNRKFSKRTKDIHSFSAEKTVAEKAQTQKKETKLNLSNEEAVSIIKSTNFGQFFNKTSKLIEKALTYEEVDALETLMSKDQVNRDDDLKDILSSQMTFSDQVYSQNRVVTALQWSPNLPETFLTAYSQNEEGTINDQVGVVLVWSLQLRSRPEFYCFSSSPVTSAVFHPFQPSIIIGGLYNGQVVVWDLRTKQTPEKRTTLNSGGHSYPIYGLSIVGSQNAHNIISASNDGRLCIWNLSMLTQPQKINDMKVKSKQPQQNQQNIEVNVTSLVFPKDDANNYYVGAEDGSIYQYQLHPKLYNIQLIQNNNSQVQQDGQYVVFEDHQAPITGLSINGSQQASPLLQNLMLSSSFDWTAKLWNPKLQRDQCIMTFESAEDYVYDVQWNGNHPSLFSTVDGEGYVDLWDISIDQEAPITKFKTGYNSLNKQSWNADGNRLAVGDSKGNVQILSLDKKALKVDSQRISNLETLIKQSR